MMRLMIRAAISLCVGLLLLLIASSGWLNENGGLIRIVLYGAIVANALGAVYFFRYFLAIVRELFSGR